MSKRNFAPRTRQFNERLIERVQSHFGSGMSRDVEALDLPQDGLADLINGRAYDNRVEGRPGTELLTPADWGVTITDNTESLATAIQSGEMYAASGRNKTADTVPSEESIFMVYGDGDTTGNDLATAKGEAPRKYDIFQVDDNGSGTEAISYLGSIRLPAFEGFGDTVATEITASKSGATVTTTAGPSITSEIVGKYFEWGDGTRDYVTGYTNATTFTVLNSGTKTSTGKGRVCGVLNASYFHESQKKFVVLVGSKLYYADDVPWSSWTEISMAGGYYLPDDSFCRMYEFDEDLILINASGFYRIKLDTPRYWRINEQAPLYENRPADGTPSTITFGSLAGKSAISYRYLYAHSRIRNTSSFVNNRINANSTLEWQSGPAKPDTDGKDYFVEYTEKEIGPEYPSIADAYVAADETLGLLLTNFVTGSALSGDYTEIDAWKEIADASFDLSIDIFSGNSSYASYTRTVGPMDFSPVENFNDLVFIIQSGLNGAFENLGVKFICKYDLVAPGSGYIRFFVDTPGVFCTEIDNGSVGTDIYTALGFVGAETTFDTKKTYYNEKVVGPFVTPSTLKTSTHLSLYRTARTDEDGIKRGNNPNLFVLVDDVPLVNVWVGDISTEGTEYYYTPTTGTFSQRDSGNVLVTSSGVTTTSIDGVDIANDRYLLDNLQFIGGTSPATGVVVGIGCSTVMRASVSGTTMTIFSGYSLSSDDEGKPVWFASGEQMWIRSVTSATTATLTESATISITGAAMNPTSRYVSDNVLDEIYMKNATYPALQPRIRSYALPTRFTEELPNCNIGSVVPGWILGATQGNNKYYFSDTAKDYLAGSYAPDLQYNDKIDSSIQEFIHQNDYVGIRSEYATWRLNLATTVELGDNSIGENIDGFNDPEIVDNSVGVEREGGTAILENGNFLTFTSEPAVKEFNMHKYGPSLTQDRIQESDIQELEPVTILYYDHILGAVLWGTK